MADLKRYYTEKDLIIDRIISIEGEQFNHMANVIRHKEGDMVVLLNGDGNDYLAKLTALNKKSADLLVLEKKYNHNRTNVLLSAICGCLKGDGNFEQAVKCSELGISEFATFKSTYCIAKNTNFDRLKRISLESFKQCKRAIPMEIIDTCEFKSAVDRVSNFDLKIIAYECENMTSLKTALQNSDLLKDKLSSKGQFKAAIIIGSEGGFNQQEIYYAKSKGFTSVSLGKNILRAETAAISACAAIMFGLGEWDL